MCLRSHRGFSGATIYYKNQRKALTAEHSSNPLYEIRAFLELIALYFSPQLFPKLFDEKIKPLQQNAELTFVRGAPPELSIVSSSINYDSDTGKKTLEYKEEALIKKAFSFVGLYNIEQLTKHFELLRAVHPNNPAYYPSQGDKKQEEPLSSYGFNPPIGFLLSSGNHAISVFYNNETQSWQLIDANKMLLASCKTEAEIAEQVLTSFSKNNITTFSTEVFCNKTQEADVKVCFSNVIKSEDWKNINTLKNKENACDSSGNSLLMNAAKIGDSSIVQSLLANPNVNDPNKEMGKWENDITPLFLAAQKGHLEVVKLFLASPKIKDPNKARREGFTPLHVAAQQGNADIVTAFLTSNKSVNSNKALRDGCTPLHIAANSGHANVVLAFLESKNTKYPTNPNLTLLNGETALHCGAKAGHVDVVKALLQSKKVISPNKPSNNGATPFYLAVFNGHLDVVKLFFEKNAEMKIDNLNYPSEINCSFLLKHAEKFGQKESLTKLLASKKISLDPSTILEKFSPLHAAIFFGHTEIVRTLVSEHFDVQQKTKDNISGLELAIAMNQLEIIEILQNAGDYLEDSLEVKMHVIEEKTQNITTNISIEEESNEEKNTDEDPDLDDDLQTKEILFKQAILTGSLTDIKELLNLHPNLIAAHNNKNDSLIGLAGNKYEVCLLLIDSGAKWDILQHQDNTFLHKIIDTMHQPDGLSAHQIDMLLTEILKKTSNQKLAKFINSENDFGDTVAVKIIKNMKSS